MTLSVSRQVERVTTTAPQCKHMGRQSQKTQLNPNAIHSILASGRLSELLRFYRNYREPHDVSPTFVYSWLATKDRPHYPATMEAAAAQTWLSLQSTTAERHEALERIPRDLWPIVVSHIPLTKLKSLQSLSEHLESLSDGEVDFPTVMQWKLAEQGLLLFEFKSQKGCVDTTKTNVLPEFAQTTTEYPELTFTLRTLTMSCTGGAHKLTLVKEVFDVMEVGELSRVTQEYQVQDGTVYKRHSLDQSVVREPTATAKAFLAQHHYLFREPSKMAFHQGNTSPSGYEWFPLFNEASTDVFNDVPKRIADIICK